MLFRIDPATNELDRVKITTLIFILAMSILFIDNAVQTDFVKIEFSFVVTILFLVVLYFWVDKDSVQIVSGIILWTAATLVFYLAWNYNGIYDSSLYAFPCLILLAYIMGSRVLFLPLLAAIFMQILLLVYSHQMGWIATPKFTSSHYFLRATDIIVVICLFTTIAYMYIRVFKLALKKQKKQIARNEKSIGKMHQQLNVDLLTKLPNERACNVEVGILLQQAKTVNAQVSFTALEVTNLKQLSNSLGHEFIDQLIICVGERLNSILHENEYLYRLKNSEFVLAKMSNAPTEIGLFQDRILQALTTEFLINEYEIDIQGAIGVAVAPFDGDSFESLSRRSHLAIQYRTKAISYYAPTMEDKENNKFFYVEALKKAVSGQQLRLFYQPKIDLIQNEIIGVEALVRWYHPTKGLIPPSDFIPIAEDSGQIVDISKWVIQQAIEDCAKWQNLGFSNISLALNLSAIDFRRGNLPQIVNKALNSSQLNPRLLELEITESTIFDDLAHIQSQIMLLQKKGVSFAIDDFGTGYSNLGYLNKFNVSTLKIDQSFIRDLKQNEHNQHIVKAIINMSDSLGVANVAEGIEDVETANLMREYGCKIGQGYYWSKPVPFEDLIKQLNA